MDDLHTRGPYDALGVLGDLCEWGPFPRAALDGVRALGCPVVQGNTDRYLALSDAALRALGKGEKAIRDLAWTRDQLGAADVAYLAALPFAHTFAGPDGQDVLTVHANAIDQETHLAPDAAPEEVARLLGGTTAAVVAFGHLHIPYTRSLEGRLLVDVASVGHPRDGDRRAAYAVLEWDGAWRATIHRVAYDLEAAAAAFRASGMPRPERSITEMDCASYEHVE